MYCGLNHDEMMCIDHLIATYGQPNIVLHRAIFQLQVGDYKHLLDVIMTARRPFLKTHSYLFCCRWFNVPVIFVLHHLSSGHEQAAYSLVVYFPQHINYKPEFTTWLDGVKMEQAKQGRMLGRRELTLAASHHCDLNALLVAVLRVHANLPFIPDAHPQHRIEIKWGGKRPRIEPSFVYVSEDVPTAPASPASTRTHSDGAPEKI